jgi:hypothetical protein
MKYLIILLTTLPFFANAQFEKVKSDLKKIHSVEQAQKYLAKNSSIKGAVRTFNSLADTTELSKRILAMNSGEVLELESADKSKQFIYKILEREHPLFFRVKYIFLDNKKVTMKKIDSLRKVIFKKLEAGDQFEDLARLYSMDQNGLKGGDLGWFAEGSTVKEFEDKVKTEDKGKIFKVDVSSQKWYYIVKKTHDPKPGTKVVALYLQLN